MATNTFQNQLLLFRRKQQLLYFFLFSFATVLVWIVISLITSQRKPGISTEQKLIAEPLNPNLNLEVIARLEQKRSYATEELVDFPIYKLVKSPDGREQQLVTIDTDEAVIKELFGEIKPPLEPEAVTLPGPPSEAPASPAGELEGESATNGAAISI